MLVDFFDFKVRKYYHKDK